MSQTEMPLAQLDDLVWQTQDFEAFKVTTTRAMTLLVAQILAAKTNVRVYVPGKSEVFALGRITEQADQCFEIALLSGEARQLCKGVGDRVEMISQLDGIEVRFQTRRLETIESSNSTVLRCSLPELVYRFQRRDAFRVNPVVDSRLELVLRGDPGHEFAFEILNLSATGVAFVLLDDALPLKPGQRFENSRLELGARVPIPCSLVIRNVNLIQRNNEGDPIGRAGAQFVNLPPPVERRLQTYIHDLEREAIRAANS